LKIYISQGTVATQLRCGGIFSNHFIKTFPQNVPVQCDNWGFLPNNFSERWSSGYWFILHCVEL